MVTHTLVPASTPSRTRARLVETGHPLPRPLPRPRARPPASASVSWKHSLRIAIVYNGRVRAAFNESREMEF